MAPSFLEVDQQRVVAQVNEAIRRIIEEWATDSNDAEGLHQAELAVNAVLATVNTGRAPLPGPIRIIAGTDQTIHFGFAYELDGWLKCPGCHVHARADDYPAQRHHMEAEHPEIVAQRRAEAERWDGWEADD